MTALVKAPVAWHKGPMLGFDLETTGIDVEQDRIVTASIITITPATENAERAVGTSEWLINPGVPIPDEAAAIHGVTTERAVAEGRHPDGVLIEVVVELADAVRASTPIVGMNVVYDLTLLDRELLRHYDQPLTHWMPFGTGMAVRPVVDVRVLDKAVDPYRRGGRKLTDLCATYRVRIDTAHESSSDALAALRVAWAIAVKYPSLQVDLSELHDWQVRWAAEQTASFAAYRRKVGQPLDDEDGSWPIRPRKGGA